MKKGDPLKISFAGEWIGNYRGHFEEVIKIVEQDDLLTATKITGDDYVPAGEVTWRAQLPSGEGEGQIAGEGFTEPKFIAGRLEIISADRIVFRWSSVGAVEYRRDD